MQAVFRAPESTGNLHSFRSCPQVARAVDSRRVKPRLEMRGSFDRTRAYNLRMEPSSSSATRGTRARALRALRDAFVRANPLVEVDTRGYVRDVAENLLPTVRLADFEADLRAGDGNELEGKFKAVHSSSALAINVFAPFRARDSELTLPGSGSVTGLEFERKCPHGVSSRAPNLDVLLNGPAEVIGIESKLTEPLSRHRAVFSPRYREKIRDERRESAWFREMLRLEDDPERYVWLDAAQLVKHAYGLAHTFPDKPVTLLYLYWEPRNAERFPLFVEHRGEIDAFSGRVAGSRPSFRAMSYPELWRIWSKTPSSWLTVHLDAMRARYEVEP